MTGKAKILYVYKVDHDLGINPNPFGEYCTLAYCKGGMRGSIHKYIVQQQENCPALKVRDMGIWVIGIAGSGLGKERWGKLLYAMQVTEVLTFEEYWADSRFEYKKRVLNEQESREIKNGGKWNYAFFRKNKNRLVCGDNIPGVEDKGYKYILISKIFIYHGEECRKQDEIFICRFEKDVNDSMRPYRIFSTDRGNPIPEGVTLYLQNEFENKKCLSRPTFSTDGFEYKEY